jgi:hypothetical protein
MRPAVHGQFVSQQGEPVNTVRPFPSGRELAALQFKGRSGKTAAAIVSRSPSAYKPGDVDLGYWNFADLKNSALRRKGETDDQFWTEWLRLSRRPRSGISSTHFRISMTVQFIRSKK